MASWINPSSGLWDDNYHAQQEAIERAQMGNSSSGGGGGYSAPDYAALAAQQLKLMQEANAPAVSSLQNSISGIQQKYGMLSSQLSAQQAPLEQRYQNLLNQITANQQKEESRVSIAGAKELGRRGISSQSGFYDQYQNQQLSPVTQYYTGQYAQTGLAKEDMIKQLMDQIANVPIQQSGEEQAVQNAIAQLMSGGNASAIQNALSIYQSNQAAQQSAAQLAFQQQQANQTSPMDLISVGEGSTIFDPNTGQALYTAPKTYAPNNDGITIDNNLPTTNTGFTPININQPTNQINQQYNTGNFTS